MSRQGVRIALSVSALPPTAPVCEGWSARFRVGDRSCRRSPLSGSVWRRLLLSPAAIRAHGASASGHGAFRKHPGRARCGPSSAGGRAAVSPWMPAAARISGAARPAREGRRIPPACGKPCVTRQQTAAATRPTMRFWPVKGDETPGAAHPGASDPAARAGAQGPAWASGRVRIAGGWPRGAADCGPRRPGQRPTRGLRRHTRCAGRGATAARRRNRGSGGGPGRAKVPGH